MVNALDQPPYVAWIGCLCTYLRSLRGGGVRLRLDFAAVLVSSILRGQHLGTSHVDLPALGVRVLRHVLRGSDDGDGT